MTYDSKQIALQHICNIYSYNDIVDLRNGKSDRYVIYSCQVINDSNVIIIAHTFADVKAYVEHCCPGITWSNKVVFANDELPPTRRGISWVFGNKFIVQVITDISACLRVKFCIAVFIKLFSAVHILCHHIIM